MRPVTDHRRYARPRRSPPPEVDARALADALARRVRGEVRFDDGSRAQYSTDASNYRQIPIGVVLPRDAEDVVEAVAVCHDYGAPIVARGGGTSLAGQSCNVAVVIDMSKYMNAVGGIDPERRQASVQPGTILDDLRNSAEAYGLTFGPDPATHNRCTLGGMIGNNACGVHSVVAGRTADNVDELDVLTYDGLRLRVGATADDELERIIAAGGRRGQIYAALRALRDRYADAIRARFPDIPRRVSGYGLEQLLPENGFNVARALVGTEGTCVLVLDAVTRLVHSPPARALLVLGYEDICDAADQVPLILRHDPVGLEAVDDILVGDLRGKGLHREGVELLPEGNGWLLVEFGGDTPQEADETARGLMRALASGSDGPSAALFTTPAQQAEVWDVRESGLGATARVPTGGLTWPGWEDSAVPPARLGDYLRDLRGLYRAHDIHASLYGHFGDGCVHTRINFDLRSADGVRRFRSFVDEAADLVVSYGGSLSGEHGDGQARAHLLEKMYGPELVQAFREFKAIWDPDGRMNPGKVVDAYDVDENLRLGVDYRPQDPPTEFKYPDDQSSFAGAMLRCVGVGKCRRLDGGTMCPSYMVTREEEHSTRGRARVLFEMLEGDVLTDGWRSEHVKDALDLCLACKGCKGECPVNVDMATYKAEFMSHYYAGRLRPRTAYTLGLIYWVSRLAARAPRLVNAAAHAPVLATAVKALADVAPQREVPRYSPETFTAWFARRGPRNREGPRVLLWPDTFTNHFDAQVGRAAVEVLEAFGFQVTLPPRILCCGRPLYDYGMLRLAKRQLRQILEVLRDDIAAGVPLIGLEPSCLVTFRDELVELFPHDEDAQRLGKQSLLLSEFLETHAGELDWPTLERQAVVHGHCHHKSILGMRAEEAVLSHLGLDYEVLDSGCCGMAGSFGFEKDKYDVAMACGERVLLPAVRAAPSDALIVTNGFSCREQVRQATGRRALHLAEVLRMALADRIGDSDAEPRRRRLAPLVLAGAAAAGAARAWHHRGRNG